MKAVSFNAEMVRAILDGSKTMTRRPVSERIMDKYYDYDDWCQSVMIPNSEYSQVREYEKDFYEVRSPWQVGETLWVRESARVHAIKGNRVKFSYGSDYRYGECEIPQRIKEPIIGARMPNGIFREAARIFLKVKRVWVERIQDISDADSKAEGILSYHHEWESMDYPYPSIAYQGSDSCTMRYTCPKQAFHNLWDSIYGNPKEGKPDYSVKANSWVWCCEFERVEK